MRSNKEIAREVLNRTEKLRAEKGRRKTKIYTASAFAACIFIVVGLSLALPKMIPDTITESSAGMYNAALLADSSIGVFVLIGVVGFVLGALVTILCVKYVRKKK